MVDVEEEMKKTALISTGTDISDNDLKNIQELATQVLDLAAYRVQLNEYLQNRMHAVAPNLSVIVGEQVGGRLMLMLVSGATGEVPLHLLYRF